MKRRTFFTGLSWLLILNVLTKPAWIFLIDRQVQNAVGHQAYGSYFALFNLSYVLLFLADAGLTNLLTQSVAAGKWVNVNQLLRTKIVLLLLYAFACLVIGWFSGVTQWKILLYVVAIQALGSLFLFLRGLLTAHQLFKTDAVFSVLDKTLMLLLCIGPVYGYFARISLELFLQLQSFATAFSVAVLFLFCWRKNFIQSGFKSQPIFLLLKSAAPFFLIVLLMAAHYRFDGFLLERLRSDGAMQAGIYASAYRLLDAANMLGYLCASFLVPFAARHRGEKNVLEEVLLPLRNGLLLVAVGVAVFAGVFAPWLQQLLYHTNFSFNNRVIAFCLAVLPAYYLVHVYGSLLTAAGELRLFIFILTVAVILNLILNLFLIPSLGALGCCLSALASQYACGIALFYLASLKLDLRRATQWFGFLALFGLGCAALFWIMKSRPTAVWIILAASLIAFFFVIVKSGKWKRFLATLNS